MYICEFTSQFESDLSASQRTFSWDCCCCCGCYCCFASRFRVWLSCVRIESSFILIELYTLYGFDGHCMQLIECWANLVTDISMYDSCSMSHATDKKRQNTASNHNEMDLRNFSCAPVFLPFFSPFDFFVLAILSFFSFFHIFYVFLCFLLQFPWGRSKSKFWTTFCL